MKDQIYNLAKRESIRQLVKYGMVGIVGLIIDIGVYYLLTKIISVHYPFSSFITNLVEDFVSVDITKVDKLISHIISSSLAIINNFLLNSYFTFKVTDKKLKRFASFASIAAIGLVVSSMLFTLFIGVMKMDDMVAKIMSILIVAALQFAVNKFFTFKQR